MKKPALFTVLLILQSFIAFAQTDPLCRVCQVSATVNETDTECIINAEGPVLYMYDDGTAENYFAWIIPGGMTAVKFPVFEPSNIYGGSIYVGDGSYPEDSDFIGKDFKAYILDDDGSNGYPGTILDSVIVTVNNFFWVEFDGFNTTAENGYYYLAMKQLYSPPFSPPVGVDEENPVYFKSYTRMADSLPWLQSSYNDFMMRLFTCKIDEEPGYDQDTFQLAFIDNFDPCIEEEPEDGTLTILTTDAEFPYTDEEWGSQAPGYYAYAVRKDCGDSLSEWKYSNIVSHLQDVEVTVNVTCPDGNTPDSLVISFEGSDCVEEYYFEESSGTGTIVFPLVPMGNYDMTVTIPGDVSASYPGYYFDQNIVLDIEMDYEFLPPTNFTVNVGSSIAEWDSPEGDDTDPWQYNLFINDTLSAQVPGTEFEYFFNCLTFGQEYTVGIQAVYDCDVSDTVFSSFTSHFLFPPRDVTASSTYGTDDIAFEYLPPMNCDQAIPPGLLSFNLYKNGVLIGNIPYEGQGIDVLIVYYSSGYIPGIHTLCVEALYDLSPYGFPGETGSSGIVCDTVEVIWGYELPFTENWDSGDFEFNEWNTYSANWVVDQDNGNDKPSAKFTNIESQTNYQETLYSNYFNAHQLTEGNIWLDFHLKLEDINAGGTEKMTVEVYDGTDWNPVYERANEGSFDWDSIHLDITPYSMGRVFRLAFEANGESIQNIQSWFVDNIELYRDCPHGCDLEIEYDTIYNEVYISFHFGACDTTDREYVPEKKSPKNIRDFTGLNLYHSMNGSEFVYIAFLQFVEGEVVYPWPWEPSSDLHCFKLTSVYESDADYCESAPFPAKDNPDQDFVCLLTVGNENNVFKESESINIFPNPATNQINIQSENAIERVSVINQFGQKVLMVDSNGKQMVINTSGLQPGVYIVHVKTEKVVVYRRIVICEQ